METIEKNNSSAANALGGAADRREYRVGLLLAGFTICVWGSTFISSKKLLTAFTPAQIMLTRFLLAYAALSLFSLLQGRRSPRLTLRQEGWFLLLGISGCSLYFYTENTALRFTLASNVSIIVAAAPILTALLAHFAGEEAFRAGTLRGFLLAFSGVVLVVCNGTFVLKLNPRGDLLALAAAACWAVYSVALRRLDSDLDPIFVTRRTAFYGAVTAIPFVLAEGVAFPAELLIRPVFAGNFLFLGLIGSGLCYVLWNHAIRILGVVTTNNFIYLNPFVTIVTARIVLGEPISPLAILGAALITAGVVAAR